jgi:hypothetical protein
MSSRFAANPAAAHRLQRKEIAMTRSGATLTVLNGSRAAAFLRRQMMAGLTLALVIQPFTAAVGLLVSSKPGHAAPADRSVIEQCSKAFVGTAFDCVCPVRFLSKSFDQIDVGLILVLWGYAIDERHDHNREIQKLKSKYGASRIDDAMYRFHSVRVDMLRQCPSDTREDEEAY